MPIKEEEFLEIEKFFLEKNVRTATFSFVSFTKKENGVCIVFDNGMLSLQEKYIILKKIEKENGYKYYITDFCIDMLKVFNYEKVSKFRFF